MFTTGLDDVPLHVQPRIHAVGQVQRLWILCCALGPSLFLGLAPHPWGPHHDKSRQAFAHYAHSNRVLACGVACVSLYT